MSLNLGNMSVANIHLSRGQVLSRVQLRTIARKIDDPLAVVGDFNEL